MALAVLMKFGSGHVYRGWSIMLLVAMSLTRWWIGLRLLMIAFMAPRCCLPLCILSQVLKSLIFLLRSTLVSQIMLRINTNLVYSALLDRFGRCMCHWHHIHQICRSVERIIDVLNLH